MAVRQKRTRPHLACACSNMPGGSTYAAQGASGGQDIAAESGRNSAEPCAASSLDQHEGGGEPGGAYLGREGGCVMRVYAADGRLLAEQREGTLRAPAGGVPVSVLRTQTPLVRHLYFVAETGAHSPASVQQY